MDGLCSFRNRPIFQHRLQSCSILSGWTGFAASSCPTADSGPQAILQYPQRMDGLCSVLQFFCSWPRVRSCSILSGWTGFAAHAGADRVPRYLPLAVSSADGRALQRPRPAAQRIAGRSCSILSGWTGFAAAPAPGGNLDPPVTCSILSGWTGFAAALARDGRLKRYKHLQYPQRMDGLCSLRNFVPYSWQPSLAVSSADGRALQQPHYQSRSQPDAQLAVSSADGRALQRARSRARSIRYLILQYPQRMDGLCSNAPRYFSRRERSDLAVSSADGRALQLCCSPHGRCRVSPCSILSGWTGFAAVKTDEKSKRLRSLQYPQRMYGLCSNGVGPDNKD